VNRYAQAPLTLLFRVTCPEEAESLHALGVAFQGATGIEPLSPEVFALDRCCLHYQAQYRARKKRGKKG
jgi:hypothetical protein